VPLLVLPSSAPGAAALPLRAPPSRVAPAEKKTDDQKSVGGILRTCYFPTNIEDAEK
jgi:hypothetical protein